MALNTLWDSMDWVKWQGDNNSNFRIVGFEKEKMEKDTSHTIGGRGTKELE